MIVWDCIYCPKLGNRYRISDLDFKTRIVDPVCPNCHSSWVTFQRKEIMEPPPPNKEAPKGQYSRMRI